MITLIDDLYRSRLLSVIDKLQHRESDVQSITYQRKTVRHTFQTMCHTKYVEVRDGKVTFYDPPDPLFGLTRNISRGGLSIVTKKYFTEGDIVEAEVFVNQCKIVYFLGFAMFSRFCGENIFETGIQFAAYQNVPILVGSQNYIESKVHNVMTEFDIGNPELIRVDR